MRLLLLKARLVTARHAKMVVASLAILGILSVGAAGFLVAQPGTTDVTETQNEQTFRTELGSSAVVTGETSAWEQGTTLTNRTVYLHSATPDVKLRSRTTVPDEQPVDVSQRVTLVYQVKRNGKVIWESEELLLADSTQVKDGEAIARTTLNPTEIRTRIGEIENEFSGIGSVSTHLRTDVDYHTDQYEGELSATGSIAFTQNAIAIDTYPSTEQTHGETVTTTKQSPRDWPLIGGLGLMGFIFLIGAWEVTQYEPTAETVSAIEQRLKRARYEEWISRGTFPRIYENAVEMASLDNLVNLAIDSNKRVVHDVEQSVYGVIDGDTVYYFKDVELDDPLADEVSEGFVNGDELPLIPVNDSSTPVSTEEEAIVTDDGTLDELFDDDDSEHGPEA